MPAGNELPPTFVFVHGLYGCDEISLPFYRLRYFRGLKPMMAALGLPCLMPCLPQGASVAERAGSLARALDDAGQPRYVLVGMSQGGLDCRYVASKLDPHGRIGAVVTIGTPHRGSCLADWALVSRNPVPALLRQFIRPALDDLTRDGCARFNESVPDRPGVTYLSWAGRRPVDEMPLWLRPFGRMLERAEGENDGQVAVSSARWGEFRGIVRADHYELVGWSIGLPNPAAARPFPHLALYKEILGCFSPLPA